MTRLHSWIFPNKLFLSPRQLFRLPDIELAGILANILRQLTIPYEFCDSRRRIYVVLH